MLDRKCYHVILEERSRYWTNTTAAAFPLIGICKQTNCTRHTTGVAQLSPTYHAVPYSLIFLRPTGRQTFAKQHQPLQTLGLCSNRSCIDFPCNIPSSGVRWEERRVVNLFYLKQQLKCNVSCLLRRNQLVQKFPTWVYWNINMSTEISTRVLKYRHEYWNIDTSTEISTRLLKYRYECTEISTRVLKYRHKYWNIDTSTEISTWVLKCRHEYWNINMSTEISTWVLKYRLSSLLFAKLLKI